MNKLSFKEVRNRSRKLILYNFKTIIEFILCYTLLSFMIVGSTSYLLFYGSLKAAGISYLGTSNLLAYLENPLSLICVLLIALIISFVTYYEVNGLIIAFDYSQREMKISLKKLLFLSLTTTEHLSKLKNFFAIIYILFMLPFVGLMNISNISFSISVPGFIMDVIEANFYYLLGFTILIIILTMICLYNMFSVHETVLHGKNWKEASASSRKLMKKKYLRTIGYLFKQSLYINTIAFIIVFALLFILLLILDLFMNIPFSNNETTITIFVLMSELILLFLNPLINVSIISVLYYSYNEDEDYIRDYEDYTISTRQKIIVAIVLLLGCLSTFLTQRYDDDMLNAKTSRPEIAAHRGESITAPENSMPAFLLALDDPDVEWIELDVHQTKDQVLVVTHDDSLNRIAGLNKKVYEVTYDELSKMDVGSWFSKDYEGLQVATLEEVLDVCKDKIKIQIEIKPTAYDKNIEQQVIDLIREKDMVDQCYIISLKPKVLENVKKIDPEIKTVYVMMISIGDVEDLDFADNFSIEESFINEDIIRRIHALKKQCFVWTINSAENVQYLVDCNVDVILTDNPQLIARKLDVCDYLNGWTRTLRKLIS